MNRLFRRFVPNQTNSNPADSNHGSLEAAAGDQKNGDQMKRDQNREQNREENRDQNIDKQYTLKPESATPNALKLTAPASNTPTPTTMVEASIPPKNDPIKSAPVRSVLEKAPSATIVVPTQGVQPPNNGPALIQLHNVVKAYQTPVGEFIALRGINLTIGHGEFVAVVGKSGSGKSTLINMITGIDRPTSGEIYVANQAIHNLAEGPMAEWRGRNLGIIFQFFQLLPMLSCSETCCQCPRPGE
jgi:ABC-type multidrug transport system fused ATPase/permease subunit